MCSGCTWEAPRERFYLDLPELKRLWIWCSARLSKCVSHVSDTTRVFARCALSICLPESLRTELATPTSHARIWVTASLQCQNMSQHN